MENTKTTLKGQENGRPTKARAVLTPALERLKDALQEGYRATADYPPGRLMPAAQNMNLRKAMMDVLSLVTLVVSDDDLMDMAERLLTKNGEI
jgi:hypothetical protein